MSGGPIGEVDIQAYVDGRLAPDRAATVEAWLAANPDEAQRLAALRQDGELLKAAYAPMVDEPVPARLLAEFGRHRQHPWRRVAAALVFVAAGAAIGFAGGYFGRPAPATPQRDVVNAAIGAHRVFVPEKRHPVEVAANEEAHLVQWLSNRLGAGIAAPKLAYFNFALVGGRLLPRADGGVAGQFMYERRPPGADAATLPVRLTLYVKPAPAGTSGAAFQVVADGDTTVFYWLDQRFGYALVGTLPREEMLQLARAAFRQLER